MDISHDSGESSCERQENGDKTTEIELPLKKARFAWQVKGKYNLKDESNKKMIPNTEVPTENKMYNTLSNNEIETDSMGQQNFDILEDFLITKDLTKLECVTDTEDSIIEKSSESKEKIPFEKYLPLPCHVHDNNVHNHSSSSSIDDNTLVPMSMVHKVSSWVEDQCISRWQYKQITKACVDNSMNEILESCFMPSLNSQEESDSFFHILDIIENLPRDNRVENEGILKATSAHGLQSNSYCNIDSDSNLNSLHVNSSLPTSPLIFEDNAAEDMKLEKNCFWNNLNEDCLFPDNITRNENAEKGMADVSKIDSVITLDSSPQSNKTLLSDQLEEGSIEMSKYYKEYGNEKKNENAEMGMADYCTLFLVLMSRKV